MSKGNILYIEDNYHNRLIVRSILEYEGYTFFDAEDGLSGYQKLQELKPKVALLDISLPGMDGIEIARRVKTAPETQQTVLIAVTGSTLEGDRERFLAAGCDDYLSKPFRAEDLIAMVAEYMREDYQPRQLAQPVASKPTESMISPRANAALLKNGKRKPFRSQEVSEDDFLSSEISDMINFDTIKPANPD